MVLISFLTTTAFAASARLAERLDVQNVDVLELKAEMRRADGDDQADNADELVSTTEAPAPVSTTAAPAPETDAPASATTAAKAPRNTGQYNAAWEQLTCSGGAPMDEASCSAAIRQIEIETMRRRATLQGHEFVKGQFTYGKRKWEASYDDNKPWKHKLSDEDWELLKDCSTLDVPYTEQVDKYVQCMDAKNLQIHAFKTIQTSDVPKGCFVKLQPVDKADIFEPVHGYWNELAGVPVEAKTAYRPVCEGSFGAGLQVPLEFPRKFGDLSATGEFDDVYVNNTGSEACDNRPATPQECWSAWIDVRRQWFEDQQQGNERYWCGLAFGHPTGVADATGPRGGQGPTFDKDSVSNKICEADAERRQRLYYKYMMTPVSEGGLIPENVYPHFFNEIHEAEMPSGCITSYIGHGRVMGFWNHYPSTNPTHGTEICRKGAAVGVPEPSAQPTGEPQKNAGGLVTSSLAFLTSLVMASALLLG